MLQPLWWQEAIEENMEQQTNKSYDTTAILNDKLSNPQVSFWSV